MWKRRFKVSEAKWPRRSCSARVTRASLRSHEIWLSVALYFILFSFSSSLPAVLTDAPFSCFSKPDRSDSPRLIAFHDVTQSSVSSPRRTMPEVSSGRKVSHQLPLPDSSQLLAARRHRLTRVSFFSCLHPCSCIAHGHFIPVTTRLRWEHVTCKYLLA